MIGSSRGSLWPSTWPRRSAADAGHFLTPDVDVSDGPVRIARPAGRRRMKAFFAAFEMLPGALWALLLTGALASQGSAMEQGSS